MLAIANHHRMPQNAQSAGHRAEKMQTMQAGFGAILRGCSSVLLTVGQVRGSRISPFMWLGQKPGQWPDLAL